MSSVFTEDKLSDLRAEVSTLRKPPTLGRRTPAQYSEKNLFYIHLERTADRRRALGLPM
jgi:hypothetical protein